MQAAAELLYIFGAEMLGDDNCGSGRQPGKKADYKVRENGGRSNSARKCQRSYASPYNNSVYSII